MREAADGFSGLLFDMDGVISDTEKLKALAYDRAFSDLYGVAIDPEDHAWRGHKESRVVKYWSEALNITVDVDLVIERKRANYLTLLEQELEPCCGAIELLKSLEKHNIPVAIVTNSSRTFANSILRRIGVLDLVCNLVCIDDVAAPKPSPEPYLRARELLGLNSKAVLAFEDTPTGGLAAKSAGIPIVAVAHQSVWGSFGECYRYVQDLSQILAAIRYSNNRVFL